MSEKTLTEKVAEYEASGETYEREFYETDGTFKGEWDFDQADYNPTEGNYSVSDYINDRQVIKAFENVTAYLADQRGLGSALLDPATIGEQTDIAEFMRDDSFRIGTKLNKASLLSNAPEAVKADYRLMQNRWELSSLTGAGETLEAVKDYGIDAIFNAETIASVSSALFSRGSSIPLDIATRIAGKKALDLAIKASRAVESKTPYAYSAAIGSLFGVAEDLAFQELELSIDQRTERDLGQTAKVAGIGALMGAGLYGATRLGAKYFSKGTDPSKELVPTPEMFDEALEGELIPESGGTIVADTWALLHRYDDPDVDDIDIDDFVKDIGGGEKTKQEIRDEIRAAISSETTAEGIQNKTKQALFKAYSKLTGNFFGKAAGVLSPYTNLSATARVLQVKLSHEFGIGTEDYASKVVEKDLSEVQKQVTGGFSEKFRGIVEDISLHSAKGTLATDINDLLMLALRGNKAETSKTIDGDLASAINVAAGNIKKLYREMGTSLKDIGVIDSLVDNYIPRMWDRKAIEANPEKLAKLLEKKGGFAPGTGEQTVRDMLDIKDQIDSGGSGGHFFSAKRKLNEIENDADFQEFLNDDVLGSLNMYTYQAGKSIAKHRVLGVNKLAEFERLWTKRIKNELSSKGVRLSGRDIKQINLLYKTATGEGMERFDKPMQNVVDTYGFVNRIALLGFATLSSLSEIFINISKAGVIKSVKGFGEALELSQKSISGDLLNKLKTNHNLTAKEAFSEMRKFSVAMDQAMAQQGNRLAGDDLMNESLQKASNKFYKLILLDQWTRFVQTASYASGKLLINENIEALAANGGKLSTNRLKTFAGELRELGIDPDEAVAWFNKGADRKDTFYEDSFLGGAARYANSVILQPTAMSGLKPLLHSNPKYTIAFQLLGYPVAFTNTILKGAAKAIIKDPVRNVPKTLAAGVIMTGVARWTNYLRSDGKSEKGKTQAEIITDSITRFGGNGIFFDSLQRARESSMYTKNAVPYAALPFGPLGSDAIKFQAQGIIPMLGGKVPLLSGSYFGKQILGEETVSDYKATLRQLQKDIFTDTLVKKRNEPRSTLGLKKGGEVNVPNAPSEPDERIDKMTGIPYNLQAGSAFMDEEDPLKVLMNDGGKVERKKYIMGAVVKGSTKLASALAERLSYKVDNYFEPEVINTAASNIEKNIKDSGIDPETPFLDAYVDALIDDTLNAKNSRSFSELKEVPEWRKLMENQDASKHGQLAEEAQKALGVTLQQRLTLETIQELRDELDPVRALESVIPNSLGNLPSEYRRIRPEGEAPRALIPQVRFLPDSVLGRLVQFLKRYIANNTDGLSEEGIERLAIENANRILRSDDPSISGLDLSKMAYMGMKDAPFEKNNMVTIKNDFRKGDVGRITGAKMSQPEGGIALYEVEVRTTGPMSDRMRLIPEDRLEHRLGSTRLVSWDTVAVSPPIDQGISGLDKLLAKDKNLQKIFKKSNLLHEAIEYSDNDSYGTLSEELQRAIKRVYFQNKVAEALTEAGYNPQRLDRWSRGEEMAEDGIVGSQKAEVEYDPEHQKIATDTAPKGGAVGPGALVPKIVRQHAEREDSILDFGSGPEAAHTKTLREEGYRVTAHDFGDNFREGVHDPRALEREGTYDMVFGSSVLNVQSTEKMLDTTIGEMAKAVTKEGSIIVNLPYKPRKGVYEGMSIREGADYLEARLRQKFHTVERIKKIYDPEKGAERTVGSASLPFFKASNKITVGKVNRAVSTGRVRNGREVFKNPKGTTFARGNSRYPVGKVVGNQVYFHKNYVGSMPKNVQELYEKALESMPEGFKFNSLMYEASKKGKPARIRFDEAPNFDTAREPITGKHWSYMSDGKTASGESKNVWHHKWQWVDDDYKGFNVDDSYEWSKQWTERLNKSPQSSPEKWRLELIEHGLPLEEKKSIKTVLTFSERSPIGFYSLAEKAAKELDRGQGTGNEFIKELKAAGVKEEELNWTGFIEKFGDKKDEDGNIIKVKYNKNEVTKFLRDNRLDVEERVDTRAWDDHTILGGATGEDPENYRAVILTLPKDKETAAGTYKSGHFPSDHNPISHVRFSEWLMNVKAQKAEMEAAEKQRKKFLESPQHLWLLAAQRNTPFKEVTASDWDLQKVAAAKTRIIDPRFYEDHANRYLDLNDLNEILWDDFQEEVHFQIAENIKYANEITPESWKYKNSKFIQDTVDMENPKVLTVEEDQSDIHADALRWVNDDPATGQRVGYNRDAPLTRSAEKELADALDVNRNEQDLQYERKLVLEDELDSLSTRAELEVPDIWEPENITRLFGNRFSDDPAGTLLYRRLKRAGVSSDLLETIQANKSEINQILDKLDQLELEQERLTNLLHMRPPKPGVPDMPFKPKRSGEGYQKLNARRMLIEAAKGDYNVILLPTGREQIFRYRDTYRKIENAGLTESQLEARGKFKEIKKKDPTAMLKHYDDVLVSHFNNIGRLLVLPKKQAKKYETSKVIDIPGGSGFDHQAKSQPTPHSEEFRHQGNKMRMFVLTPEMKKDILRGLPQFYAGGLMKRRAYSEGGLYKILKGDTLSEIARDNNTSVDELAKLNKISNPSSIYEGQDLILPTTTSDLSSQVKEALSNFGQGVKQTVASGATAIASNATGVASDLSTQTEEVLQNTAEAIGDQASETFDIVAESAGKGINALKNLLNEGIDKTKEAIDSYEAPELRQPSSTFIPAPVKLVLSSFFNKGTGTTFTEEDIGEDVTDIIDQVAKRGLAAGRKNASYEDYPDTERKLSAAALVGAAKYADGRPIPESIRAENARMRNEVYPKNLVGLARFVSDVATDPVVKAVLSVGGFSIHGEKGNYHIKEAFNFNTANVSKDDWYAWVRNKLSTSGLMPMTENEGVKVNLKIKGI